MKNDGGPAFSSGSLDVAADLVTSPIYDGISKHDWFVGHAPPMPEDWHREKKPMTNIADKQAWEIWRHVDWAISYADAMLAEREKDSE